MDASVPRGAALLLAFDLVRPMFGKLSQPQVDGINRIVADFNAYGDGDRRHLAYLLATAKHETWNTMQPVKEVGAGKGHDYGRIDATGKAPYGRGYVQLTHAVNYQKADSKLGLGGRLAKDYDLALDPDIAARVLIRGCIEGWFTGKKLSSYSDFKNMRRVINGLDKADLIATYANSFLRAISA
jgi:hypothetical protein